MSTPSQDPTGDDKAAATCQRFITAAKDFDTTLADDTEYDVVAITACLSQVVLNIARHADLARAFAGDMWPKAVAAINDASLYRLDEAAAVLAALSGLCEHIEQHMPTPAAANS